MQNEENVQYFVEEAQVHLETVETELLKMDTDNFNSENINNIFRGVHSIKGSAGFFDFKKIVKVSHCIENIFGEVRACRFELKSDMVDILLSANDLLKKMVGDVYNSEDVEIEECLLALSSILSHDSSTILPKPTGDNTEKKENSIGMDISKEKMALILKDISKGKRLFRIIIKMENDSFKSLYGEEGTFAKIKSIGRIIDCRIEFDSNSADDAGNMYILMTSVLELFLLTMAIDIPEENITEISIPNSFANISIPSDTNNIIEQPMQINAEQKDQDQQLQKDQALESVTKKKQNISIEETVRVNVTLLNNLMNLASEMILARNRLINTLEIHKKDLVDVDEVLQNVNHITTDLQEKIMQTRMQPISIVFDKFPRIIRELSKKVGKELNLNIHGNEVELDKSIIESLADPLTHLIRNAVDHGLENPDERELIGKSRIGEITMKAYHEGGYVTIDVCDDGKGINVDSIRSKAIEKGFIDKKDISVYTEHEILQFLFSPGFSTAEKITDISGRGVGLDVVKTNIEKLGGNIEIFTEVGNGTTFRLLLPLTLAIIPSLIVYAEGIKFALPQINLQEIIRIEANDPDRCIEYIDNAEVIRLRGNLLPIVHLADVLGLHKKYLDPRTNTLKIDRRRRLFSKVRARDAQNNDNLEKRHKSDNMVKILVVKIGSRKLGIAIDSIFGSEEILVKPLPAYIKNCKCFSGVTILGDGKTAMILDPGGIIEKANLRFAESNTAKKNDEPLFEEYSLKENQNLLIFKCSGPETLALDMSMISRIEEINPNDIEKMGTHEYIKYRGGSLMLIRPENYLSLIKSENTVSRMFVVIPKLNKSPLGILIEKIYDTLITNVKINQQEVSQKGFIGSTILNDKLVHLLNIYQLFEMADPEHYKIEISHVPHQELKILYVEDTPFFMQTVKKYLEDIGYKVFTSDNGKDAWEFLDKTNVDLVLTDIDMPIMDGLELVKKIRRNDKLKNLPVIALTSLNGEGQRKVGLDAGFDEYENKLDKQRLLQIIKNVLDNRRLA